MRKGPGRWRGVMSLQPETRDARLRNTVESLKDLENTAPVTTSHKQSTVANLSDRGTGRTDRA